MAAVSMPCGWTVDPCGTACADLLGDLDPATRALYEAWAVDFLWRATGRRYGLCETTYRPCARQCGQWWDGMSHPARIDGEWVNLSCGSCRTGCSCTDVPEVVLSDVEAVVGITVDGVELDPAEAVIVYDRRRIVRTDGLRWPACQDLTVPGDSDGAWQITVLQGAPIPAGGSIVAGLLACEFAKACAGDSGCRLPQRVQTVTRQGVTIGFQDSFDTLDDLKVGIFEIDAWVAASRWTGTARPRILSPDVPRPSVQTWPTGVAP